MPIIINSNNANNKSNNNKSKLIKSKKIIVNYKFKELILINKLKIFFYYFFRINNF